MYSCDPARQVFVPLAGDRETGFYNHVSELFLRWEPLDAFYEEAEDPSDPLSKEDACASLLIVDETFALTDTRPPSLDLAPMMKKYWRKARYKGVSVIALTQAPPWFRLHPGHSSLLTDRRSRMELLIT